MRPSLQEVARRLRPGRWSRRLSGAHPGGWRRATSIMLTIAIVASIVAMAIWPAPTSASYTNVLYNGNFELGFSNQAGCGAVGNGWQCFTNGGAANYGFYDDQWYRTVAEGGHSQLIEINTKKIDLPDADRYAGIYQTVKVVDWANYTLTLQGMIRTTNMEGDKWRYRVEVGWTYGPYPNWQAVGNWTDVGWDDYYERTNPGGFLSFSTPLMAQSDYVTVYLRVWKKWGVPEEEIDINFDAVSLTGPSPYHYDTKPVHPIEPWPVEPVHPVQPIYPDPVCPGGACPQPDPICPGGGCPQPQPICPGGGCPQPVPPIGACVGPDLVYNGSFEMGFTPIAFGNVGTGWGYFTNGGAANYGYYDEQWPPVVADGKHGQLIEINSKGVYPTDPNRYAGIYQYIHGLKPGATYEFSMKGELRGAGNEDDPYRFSAEWGYAPGYTADWKAVSNWTEMNLGPIYERTSPGPLAAYTMKFVATSKDMTLFIRGIKKWAITNVEMDFNLDAIGVKACMYTGGPYPEPYTKPVIYPQPDDYGHGYQPKPDYGCGSTGCGDYGHGGDACVYVVKPGDNLSTIAKHAGVGMWELAQLNGISNPNFIYVGQRLQMPGCAAGAGAYGAVAAAPAYAQQADYYPASMGGQVDAGGYYETSAGSWDAPAVAAGAPMDAGGYYETAAGYWDSPAVEAGAPMDAGGYYETAAGYWDGSAVPAGPGAPMDATACSAAPECAGAGGGRTYRVQPGDTLSQIAAWNGVSVGSLMSVNAIANPNIIFVGQMLIIP